MLVHRSYGLVRVGLEGRYVGCAGMSMAWAMVCSVKASKLLQYRKQHPGGSAPDQSAVERTVTGAATVRSVCPGSPGVFLPIDGGDWSFPARVSCPRLRFGGGGDAEAAISQNFETHNLLIGK